MSGSSLWNERRRALLLAADALEARSSEKWAQADDLLFSVRSVRTDRAEVLRREDAADRIRAMLDEDAAETFPLPFPKLNECLLGGLRRGQIAVIAADPAHGKSILVDQILEHCAAAGASCHLMLNEMQPADRTARWIQRRTKIAEERVLARALSDDERSRVVAEAATFPFDMTQIAGETFRDVADRIREARADVVAIDLLSRFDYREERELRLGMTTLADAAHTSNGGRGCALILAHHLNEKRVADNGARRTPSLTDIRDSGSVKNFSDVVMFLNREHDSDEPTKLLSTADFYAVKVRAGRPGGVKVRLSPVDLSFHEVQS